MTVFEVLLEIKDIDKFSEIVFDMVEKAETKENLKARLKSHLSEKELWTIQSIARSDYLLFLDGKVILESVLKATRDTHARYQA